MDQIFSNRKNKAKSISYNKIDKKSLQKNKSEISINPNEKQQNIEINDSCKQKNKEIIKPQFKNEKIRSKIQNELK